MADGEALMDLVADACLKHGTDPVEVCTELDRIGVDTLTKATSFTDAAGEAAFLQSPPTAAGVKAFADAMLSATDGSAMADSLGARCLFTTLGRAIAAAAVVPPSKGTAAPERDEDDEVTALGAYKDLYKMQGRYTELSSQCVFVGSARRSVKKHGHISQVPGLAKLTRYGHAASKRKLASFAEGASLEVDDTRAKTLDTLQACHRAAKDAVRGILAAKSVQIDASAFGGRDFGWITPAGKTSQVRVMLDAEAAERLECALTGSQLTEPGAYVRMANGAFTRYANLCARLTQHPGEVIEKMVESEHALFDTDPGYTESAADTASTAPSHEGWGEPWTSGGVCAAWLDHGYCDRKGWDCMQDHPKRLKNVMGRSQGRQHGGSSHGGSSNGWPAGGNQQGWGKGHQNWGGGQQNWGGGQQSWSAKGGGKGGGKGSAGKGSSGPGKGGNGGKGSGKGNKGGKGWY